MDREVEKSEWKQLVQWVLSHTEDRELLVLGVSLAALGYFMVMRRSFFRFGGSRWLLSALVCLVVGLVATNVEGFTSPAIADFVNLVEHVAYLLHTLLVVVALGHGEFGAKRAHD